MPRCVQQRTHAARSIANTARGTAPPSAAAPPSPPSAAAAPPSAAALPAASPTGTVAPPTASARANLSSVQKRHASAPCGPRGVAGRAGLRWHVRGMCVACAWHARAHVHMHMHMNAHAPAVVREYRAECRRVDLEQSARLIVEPLRRADAAVRATTARAATACAARAALR